MQGQVEGGFMGRTNKLVDGCYSFWQGGIFPLLRVLMPDYLAQTHIPTMPKVATTDASRDEGASNTGSATVSSGNNMVGSGQDVMHLEGLDPVVRALNDLHRTKVGCARTCSCQT